MNEPKLTVKELFDAVVDMDSPEMAESWLSEFCVNEEQRRQVESLLTAHQTADTFLETPVASLSCESFELFFPKQIGPYRIEHLIAEGGFGQVFLATQTSPIKRKVALKLLRPGRSSADVLSRFSAERQALAMMDHPNIAKVYDGGKSENDRPFFVMEFVPGESITKYCDAKQLTVKERVRVFIDVCRAIEHAHQKGIIHRDIKPSNVLVREQDGNPVPKVIDFGVAKAIGDELTDQPAHTTVAQLLGTPHYMSPEQATKGGIVVDTRSDVYSLGVLLFELLAGSTPNEQQTKGSTLANFRNWFALEEAVSPHHHVVQNESELSEVASNRSTNPRQLKQLLKGDLESIAQKALANDRNMRYQSASDMASDLERYLGGEMVTATPPSNLYYAKKLFLRHKVACLATMACVLMLVTTTASSLWQASIAERSRLLESQRRQYAEGLTGIFLTLLASDVETPTVDDNPFVDDLPDGNYKDKLDQVVTGYQKILAAQRRKLPADHPQILGTQLQLATCLRRAGFHRQAKPHLERSLPVAVESLGTDHFLTLETEMEIAACLIDEGQIVEGLEILEKCLDTGTRIEGGEGHLVYTARHHIAHAYQRNRQFEQALSELNFALNVAEQNASTIPEQSIYTRMRIGDILLQKEDMEGAREQLRQSVELANESFGPVHPLRLIARLQSAHLDMLSGKVETGIQELKQFADIAEANFGGKKKMLSEMVFHLSQAYPHTREGDHEKAIEEKITRAARKYFQANAEWKDDSEIEAFFISL